MIAARSLMRDDPRVPIRGICKNFFEDRGYGFITRDDGTGDVFVHVRDVQRSGLDRLVRGDLVQFEIEDSRSGRPQAVRLRLLPQPAPEII
jgi:CspA family cold shock protein